MKSNNGEKYLPEEENLNAPREECCRPFYFSESAFPLIRIIRLLKYRPLWNA